MISKNKNNVGKEFRQNETKPQKCRDDLEKMALELATLAEQKLRNGVLKNALAGQEDDIRQDAVILALGWYSNHLEKPDSIGSEDPWNIHKNIAIAFKFIKRRYLRKYSKSPKTISIENLEEHSLELAWEYSPNVWHSDQMKDVLAKGLKMAVASGALSRANGIVARLVLLHGASVNNAASHLGITRGAVYQHINKIKRVIGPMIDRIEMPSI